MTNEYFACDGGPHLLLPNSERDAWRGVGPDFDTSDSSTDYARAGAVEPPMGLISVGKSQALVLAGNPPLSGWGGKVEQGRVFVHVFETWSGADMDSLSSAAEATAAEEITDTGWHWTLAQGGVTLMFAGDTPGRSVYGEVSIPIPSGKYKIYKGHYEGDLGKVLIVRLERLVS